MTAVESEEQKARYEPQIKSLLQGFKVSSSIIEALHENDSWGARLSGGQKKIISFVRAILEEPQVIIYDETFAGLDPDTLTLLQNEITEYKNSHPGSMMFIIDHEAAAHNKTGFYDHCVHFENHAVSFVQLSGGDTGVDL